MILGARESGDHQLSRAPKIIEILGLVFARGDFEIFFKLEIMPVRLRYSKWKSAVN